VPDKTKEELSAQVNKVLGTTIDFTKLTKEELQTMTGALTKLKENEFPLPLLDRPLAEMLGDKFHLTKQTTLRDVLGLPKGSKKGLLGFGLLSRLIGDEKDGS